VLLVVLDGEGRQVDFLYLVCGGSATAFRVGDNFLRKHAPPARDAQQLFVAARNQARATGRQVWILAVNPSRPGSVRMLQWWQEHRELLEREYVFVKLVQGCDAKIDEVMSSLEIDSSTEPWSAITNASGKMRTGVDAVLPESTDDRDNFRNTLEGFSQKLTQAELDRLRRSLGE
jgi:hypothetical protein